MNWFSKNKIIYENVLDDKVKNDTNWQLTMDNILDVGVFKKDMMHESVDLGSNTDLFMSGEDYDYYKNIRDI